MSHIDEGLLHAWLDGALHDEARSTRDAIELHLAVCADCRARLEEARQLRDEVAEILAHTTPPGVGEIPPFEQLVPRVGEVRQTTSPTATRRSPMSLTWAATLILALGAGWWAHHLTLSGADAPGSEEERTALGEHVETDSPDNDSPDSTAAPGGDGASGPHPLVYSGAMGVAAGEGATSAMDIAVAADTTSAMDLVATTDVAAAAGVVTPTDLAATVGVVAATDIAAAMDVAVAMDASAGAATPGTQVQETPRPALGLTPAVSTTPAMSTTLATSIARAPALSLQPIEPSAVYDDWVRVDRAAAEAWTGAPLAIARGLPILEIAISDLEGTRAARVQQVLPDGGLLELLQQAGHTGSEDTGASSPGVGRRVLGFLGRLPQHLAGGDEPGRGGRRPQPNDAERWTPPAIPTGAPAVIPGGKPAGTPAATPGSQPVATPGGTPVVPSVGASVVPPVGKPAGVPLSPDGSTARRPRRIVPDPLDGAGAAVLRRDGILITIRALVPPDSLRVLLHRVY